MEWTDQHGVLMLREMIVSDAFSFKKGSVSRGNAWDSIAEKLNHIDSPRFGIKDKRRVRERWELFPRKFKSKNREEAAASGIAVEDVTERETLIEELIAREETAKPDDNLSVQQKKDKDKAEDIRKKSDGEYGRNDKANYIYICKKAVFLQLDHCKNTAFYKYISVKKLLFYKSIIVK